MPPRGPRGDWNRPPGNMHQGFQGKKSVYQFDLNSFHNKKPQKQHLLIFITMILLFRMQRLCGEVFINPAAIHKVNAILIMTVFQVCQISRI